MRSYQELLNRLFSVNLHGGMKLGLENCLKLNQILDSPIDRFSSIHVAGTNGKGSVSTKIAAALQATGLRVGLYTSPHISSFRERIRINGQMISEEDVQKHLTKMFEITDKFLIPATFFELTTLMAFNYFAAQNIDVAVVETGLGGRLDATNIITPLLSIITSISLDHTDILGSTLEEITKEKGGIIKPNVPVAIGPRVPSNIIKEIAASLSSPCIIVDDVQADDYQVENNAIARAALKHLQVPDYAIEVGLQASPACRMEILPQDRLASVLPHTPLPSSIVLDVAHNPDGIRHLIRTLSGRFANTPFRFIIGLSKNKDIASCFKEIMPIASHIHLVEASSERAASNQFLYQELLNLGFPSSRITLEKNISGAIKQGFRSAGISKDEILVICGTFFIMAEARRTLGFQEPFDSVNLNESNLNIFNNDLRL